MNEKLRIALNALNEKKAKEINAVKIGDLTVLVFFLMMRRPPRSTHVRALCDEVEEKLEEAGVKPHHIEGRTTGWIVLDYGTVIVHIFSRNDREFYGLDKMWSDGEAVDMSEILTGSEEENTDEN